MWGQEHMVNVSNGLYSVVLSDLPYTIPEDAELEIQVGNDVLSPRHSFTSVPFAFNSHLALHANHSTYSDTAYYVMNASIPDTAHFSHQSRHRIRLEICWTTSQHFPQKLSQSSQNSRRA